MARIRSIHPGLASDEAYMSMSMAAKAAWPLLWTECDDHGIFEWKPIVLKARIFPADNVDFGAILSEYQALGCVKIGEVDGKPVGLIRNFCRYQRPKNPSYRFQLESVDTDFIGLTKGNSDSPPPVLPQSSPSPTEKPPQMKEEGGRMDIGDRKEAAAIARTRSDLDHIESECRKAAGTENSPSPGLLSLAPILGLLDAGYSLEGDILPAIRLRPNPKAGSWSYFLGQIRDYRTDRLTVANDFRNGPAAPTSRTITDDIWRTRLNTWVESGYRSAGWFPNWGPLPGRGGCEVPAHVLSEFPPADERAA